MVLHHTKSKSQHIFMPSYHNHLLVNSPKIYVTMSPLETKDLNRIFESLDQNCDGLLSLDELHWLLERTNVHVNHEELVSLVGEDGLNFDEFSTFYESILLKSKKNSGDLSSNNGDFDQDEEEDSDLYKAFKVFDLDGDGLISSQELQRVLWRLGMWDCKNGLDVDRIIRKYDVNSDGFVDFHEFKSMMLAH